jgi:hypothetical protein
VGKTHFHPKKETAMNQDSRNHTFPKHGSSRLWKRIALGAAAILLMMGITGCALDDILTPVGGDIPFEQEQTTPPEMGSVDNAPTVPDDSSFDNVDDRPL